MLPSTGLIRVLFKELKIKDHVVPAGPFPLLPQLKVIGLSSREASPTYLNNN